MNIISFREPVSGSFRKSAGGAQVLFEAGRDYLISNHQAERLLADANIQRVLFRLSYADMRLPNFRVRGTSRHTGESVLLYNGGGGYGDQILTWPVANILARWYHVHVLVDPGNNACWWQLPFVKTISHVPIQWPLVQLFPNIAVFEYVANRDEHPDQEHPVDAMLRKIGLNPSDFTPEEKVVTPSFSSSERLNAQNWINQHGRIGLYQLSSANAVRALTSEDSVYLLTKLAEAHPDIHWLGLYDEFVPEVYANQLKEQIEKRGLKNVEATCFANLRDLWALTARAAVVVAPDSMMVHVAGSLGTPCVGLWGPIHPDKRVAYYRNHHALFVPGCCPLAPCHAYGATFPRYCPPKPGGRKTCEVLAGIAPDEVVACVGRVAAQPEKVYKDC